MKTRLGVAGTAAAVAGAVLRRCIRPPRRRRCHSAIMMYHDPQAQAGSASGIQTAAQLEWLLCCRRRCTINVAFQTPDNAVTTAGGTGCCEGASGSGRGRLPYEAGEAPG